MVLNLNRAVPTCLGCKGEYRGSWPAMVSTIQTAASPRIILA